MQKKCFPCLLPILAVVLFLWQATLVEAEGNNALLWRIETDKGTVSYLFGTIHSEDPRVLALPAPVTQAFSTADTLVLEMDLGGETATTMGRAMLLPPEKNLHQLLDDELYRQSVSAMTQRGYTETVVNRLWPWAIVLTLNMPQAKTGMFLDYVLYQRAIEQGMTVHGLEQMEEQLGVFTSLTLDEQISLLRDTLREQAALPQLLEQLMKAYLERDLQALATLGEQSMQGSDKALQQRFMGALLDERNELMVVRLLPLMEKGGAFVAIGALHLPGKKGVLALLRQHGLHLTPLY